MNELRRMVYLDALGLDSYVSRGQQPGAAPTRRLALVRSPDIAPQQPPEPVPATEVPQGPAALRREMATPSAGTSRPAIERETPRERAAAPSVTRLSISILAAGQWLWLESLGDMPLMQEQVWLVESMANALGVAMKHSPSERRPGGPTVMRFDWPMHNNPQLDSGDEAARASLTGFLQRQQQEHAARALILLGESCRGWIESGALEIPCVTTLSTRELLDNPRAKEQAWKDLTALLEPRD